MFDLGLDSITVSQYFEYNVVFWNLGDKIGRAEVPHDEICCSAKFIMGKCKKCATFVNTIKIYTVNGVKN